MLRHERGVRYLRSRLLKSGKDPTLLGPDQGPRSEWQVAKVSEFRAEDLIAKATGLGVGLGAKSIGSAARVSGLDRRDLSFDQVVSFSWGGSARWDPWDSALHVARMNFQRVVGGWAWGVAVAVLK